MLEPIDLCMTVAIGLVGLSILKNFSEQHHIEFHLQSRLLWCRVTASVTTSDFEESTCPLT